MENTSQVTVRKTTDLEAAGVRFLDPETTHVYIGAYGTMHVEIRAKEWKGERLYRGVFAILAFPISNPDRFISLRYFDDENREEEIGMIENPSLWSKESMDIVRQSLARNYFEHRILRVYSVEFKYGLLFIEAESLQGKIEFLMRWRYDRTQDYGKTGKVLLDVHENRYVIPNVDELPKADREALTRYIYW